MSPKGFAVLAAATLASIGLAAWAIVSRDLPITAAHQPEPMFAGLLDRLGEVQAVRITGGEGGSFTLRRAADGKWGVEERGGYSADPKRVRDLALGLANLRLIEAKTSKPERLPRLELGDPTAPEAKSRQVELLDTDGRAVAAAVVGKTKYGLYGGGRSGVYVRRVGEDQAWLAAGELDVPAGPTDVVVRDVIDVPRDEVARVTLGAGGPGPVVLAKVEPGAEAYSLQAPPAPPEGKKVDSEKLDRLAGTLSSLTMQDVKPLAAAGLPADAPTARFETWDGLVVEARAAKLGEGDKAEHWAAFAVSEGQPLRQPPAPAAEGDKAAPPATVEPGQKPLPERVAELRARLDGWAFKLPELVAGRVGWTLNDLLAAGEGTS